MTYPCPCAHKPHPSRRGFTLIELMVVVVIIGILIALLLPALASAMRAASDARVSTELNQLAQGLAEFKTRFGDYPPSRIMLSEEGVYPLTDTTMITTGGTADLTMGQLAERSLRYLRKFFPKLQPPNPNAGYWHDFNGDGVFQSNANGGLRLLEGHECLVFFLGGIPTPDLNTPGRILGMSGFGKDPQRPFTTTLLSAPALVRADNRMMPTTTVEFRSDRLIDDDLDGMPGYLDPYGSAGGGVSNGNIHYYVYFSSYGGNLYDPNDVNFLPDANAKIFRANPGIAGSYQVSGFPPFTFLSPSPNPYTNGTAIPGNGYANFINPNSFQILSSGSDGSYGPGGEYGGEGSGDHLPSEYDSTKYVYPDPNSIPDSRRLEKDNIANFSKGKLD